MPMPLPSRLATKLNLLVISLVLLTAASIAALISERGIREDRAQLLDLGVSLAELGSRQTEFALYTEDATALRSDVDNLASNVKIGYVVLLNKDRRPLLSKVVAENVPLIPAPDAALFQGGTQHTELQLGEKGTPYFDIVAPVQNRGDNAELFPEVESADKRVLGYVRIGVRQDSLEDKAHEIVISTIALTLVVVALGVFATLLITRRILGPVQVLVRATHEIAGGNLADPVNVQATGEIGELAASFNGMLARLRDYRDRVEEAHATLEAKVEVRTRELQLATEEAKTSARLALEASRVKSEFLATMSHEIRTPMNGVLGMTELLRGTPLNERQHRFVDTVYHSGQSLLRIINDILDFSKIEAGKIELEQINFDLRELVEDVCGMFAQPAHAKGLEIACLVPHALPIALRGDPARLRQILTNIVGNAVKFTGEGEVSVRVQLLAEGPGQARLRFDVRDTGIGIAEDKQQRIFEAFSQADSSTTRSFGGTGLGLAISKQLVELMGGRMGVISRPGHGATFWFEVDAAKQDTSARKMLAVGDKLHGLRVLVVDDNATNREILEEQLAAWKMRCTSLEGGHGALAALHAARAKGEPFELAVLDLHMPEMDGLDLARTIKNTPELAATPLIMLSSATLQNEANTFTHDLIRCNLTKPVRESDLFHAIATAIEEVISSAIPDDAPAIAVANLHDRLSCRVLLAEDNRINQDVAKAMLEMIGVRTTVVSHGRQVLSALEKNSFDLILMDCQMPEMDGYAATAAVRERERDNPDMRRIPIVALTANAIAGDREQCLAAGMDDYLSKPFTQKELAAIIGRWVPHAAAGGTIAADVVEQTNATKRAAAKSGDVSVAADMCVNPQVLESIRSMGQGLLEEVVRHYLQDTPERMEQIRVALAANDPEALRRSAHALKSGSANLGAERFAAICKVLESLGRSGTTEGGAARHAEAEQEYTRVRDVLQAAVTQELTRVSSA